MTRTVYARVSKVDTNGTKGEVETKGGEIFSFQSDNTFTIGDPVEVAVSNAGIVTAITRVGKLFGRQRLNPAASQPYWKEGKYQ